MKAPGYSNILDDLQIYAYFFSNVPAQLASVSTPLVELQRKIALEVGSQALSLAILVPYCSTRHFCEMERLVSSSYSKYTFRK